MVRKIGDKKVDKVDPTNTGSRIEDTEAVSGISSIEGPSVIEGTGRVGRIMGRRRPTRTMTMEEREQLFRIINEEADKMFQSGGIPSEHREIVKDAVKMAVDSGLLTADEDDTDEKKKDNKKK